MPIDFSVEPEFQKELDWIRQFVDEKAVPLDLAFAGEDAIYDKSHPVHDEVIRPLQNEVKDRGLWVSFHIIVAFIGLVLMLVSICVA